MNRLLKVLISILLVVATVCFTGCKKTDEPNIGGNNENNGGNGSETPEIPTIVSTSEVQYDGIVYLEAVYNDESKMYFKILSPTEVAFVNGEFYYQDNPSLAYMYRGEVVIPRTITHLGTTYSVVSIDKKTFYQNAMVSSVYIPNSVRSILTYSFQNCNNLINIHMSDSIQSIGSYAFVGCPCYKHSVTIPKHIKTLGGNAFESETVFFNADSCYIAGSESLGCYPYWCSAFPNMNSISFGDGVKILPSYLFTYTHNITTIEIPTIFTKISDYAFYECERLSTVSIPNSVNSIGKKAFSNCIYLTEIIFPSSIAQIQHYAFYIDHPSFSETFLNTSITCMANNPPILGNNVFGNRNVQVIHVPVSSVEAYKTAEGWSEYADVIVGI